MAKSVKQFYVDLTVFHPDSMIGDTSWCRPLSDDEPYLSAIDDDGHHVRFDCSPARPQCQTLVDLSFQRGMSKASAISILEKIITLLEVNGEQLLNLEPGHDGVVVGDHLEICDWISLDEHGDVKDFSEPE